MLVLSAFESIRSPAGVVPAAVAVLSTLPASTWAWVMVTVAVQVRFAPGTSVGLDAGAVTGQLTGSVVGSVTASAVRVRSPTLVSTKV